MENDAFVINPEGSEERAEQRLFDISTIEEGIKKLSPSFDCSELNKFLHSLKSLCNENGMNVFFIGNGDHGGLDIDMELALFSKTPGKLKINGFNLNLSFIDSESDEEPNSVDKE